MFGKVIVFGLFEMIQKKKSEDLVAGSRLGLRVGSGTAMQAVTLAISLLSLNIKLCGQSRSLTVNSQLLRRRDYLVE